MKSATSQIAKKEREEESSGRHSFRELQSAKGLQVFGYRQHYDDAFCCKRITAMKTGSGVLT
jgi:hypothetical protein